MLDEDICFCGKKRKEGLLHFPMIANFSCYLRSIILLFLSPKNFPRKFAFFFLFSLFYGKNLKVFTKIIVCLVSQQILIASIFYLTHFKLLHKTTFKSRFMKDHKLINFRKTSSKTQ